MEGVDTGRMIWYCLSVAWRVSGPQGKRNIENCTGDIPCLDVFIFLVSDSWKIEKLRQPLVPGTQ
jgi:hypothetical protein